MTGILKPGPYPYQHFYASHPPTCRGWVPHHSWMAPKAIAWLNTGSATVRETVHVPSGDDFLEPQSWASDQEMTSYPPSREHTAMIPTAPEFLDLPAEIRLRIYDLLVQQECVFVVNPLYHNVTYYCAMAKIMPGSSDKRHYRIRSLMLSCRQIKTEVYAILYGSNRFIFKIGPPKGSQLGVRLKGDRDLLMWNKVFHVEPSPLWPLTAETVPYAKSIAFVIHPYSKSSRQTYDTVRGSIESAVALLRSATELRQVDIYLRDVQPQRLSQNPDVIVENTDTDGLSITLSGNALNRPLSARNQCVLEPFRVLYNIKDVTINGDVSPAFAEQLKFVMMRSSPTGLVRSPLDGVKERVLIKRGGWGRRRRVEVPVLEYWHARYEWDLVTNAP